ncbi:hypothetical protein [Endozoicomonas sp. ONNA2]|uniref:hypothetical protein n=1 Tax=Endozoicomonas sp. ONNA2 TaxID=2828741 RepID=UPI0021472B47|nr:hypothetical protein [Endozoicomonas sp. ONNA2]
MDTLLNHLQSLGVDSSTVLVTGLDENPATSWGRKVTEAKVYTTACSGDWYESTHALSDAAYHPAPVVANYSPVLFMGNPVNSEKNRHLSSRDKITAVISAFGPRHPFMGSMAMHFFADSICCKEEELSPLASHATKCNYLFSAFLAYQYAGELEAAERILTKLEQIDTNFLDRYLRTVELYQVISRQSPAAMDYEQVQELSRLVQETEFFPAAWLLVRLSCNMDKLLLVSPFQIPRLLVPFLDRQIELKILGRAFAPQLLDAFTIHITLTEEEFKSCLEKITPVDLFMLDLGGLLMNLGKRRENVTLDEYPQGFRTMLALDWNDIVISRRKGGRNELRTQRRQYTFKKVKQVMEESGKKMAGTKALLNDLTGDVFRDAGKDTRRRRAYKRCTQKPEVEASPFTSGLIKLTQGLMYLCSTGFERHPSFAVVNLVNAVNAGWSPLLLKDAGDIHLGYGRFGKALEKYQDLRSYSGLPEALEQRLDSLIEICELNIPGCNFTAGNAGNAENAENAEKDAASAPVVVKAGRVKRRKNRKSHQHSKVAASQTVAAPKQQSPITEQAPQTGQGLSLALANEPVRSDSADSKSPVKPPALTNQRSPVIAPQPSAKVTTTARQLFIPRKGYFSDSDLMVQRFIREINTHREKSNLVAEKRCIEQWLRQDRVYGRICEDAAWFYLRQCIFSMQMDAVILAGDNLEPVKNPQQQMLHFALAWLCRAMACYLAHPIEKPVLSARLQDMLVQLHHQNPEQKKDAEACKRLRSGCSGFGHVFSELSGRTEGKMRKAYDDKGRTFFALKRIADPLYYP